MALSAIEIYNKPNFSNREQIFCILMTSAWEALLKAKILLDNSNKISAIYIKSNNGHYKKNRNQEPLTISIDEAINKINPPNTIRENILQLVRIRDAAIHLTAESKTLPYIAFQLGTASVRNYAKLINKWFGISLSDYNFYILPLGFSYPFKTLSGIEFKKEPEVIMSIISDIESCKKNQSANDEYFFVCEIQTTLISAKKITENTDVTVGIDPESNNKVIISRKISLIDQYPYSWSAAYEKCHTAVKTLTRPQFTKFISENSIKDNPKYSTYNFRTKQEEIKGPTKLTPSIYNEEFIRLVISNFENNA